MRVTILLITYEAHVGPARWSAFRALELLGHRVRNPSLVYSGNRQVRLRPTEEVGIPGLSPFAPTDAQASAHGELPSHACALFLENANRVLRQRSARMRTANNAGVSWPHTVTAI